MVKRYGLAADRMLTGRGYMRVTGREVVFSHLLLYSDLYTDDNDV